jgi:hypothetical protein
MAHYAFLDENNIVTEVITGRNEDEVVDGISNWEEYYGNFRGQTCKRTSYNNNIRKNYAGIGYIYDPVADHFFAPQPYPSWVLDSDAKWQAPIPMPVEESKLFIWDEPTLSWVEVELPTE